MDLDKAIENCVNVKKYSSKKPNVTMVTKAIEAAHSAPTAGSVQPIKYVIVEDPSVIEKLGEACQQDFVKSVPYVVILVSDPRQVTKLFGSRADDYLKHNAGAVAQNFMLKLGDLGLSSSMVAIFADNLIRQETGIPDGMGIELIITVGFELEKGKTKKKFSHSLVNRVFYGRWGNKFHKPLGSIRRGDV